MTPYFLVKYLHVLGAIVILGTGTGIAFFIPCSRNKEITRMTAIVTRLARDPVFTEDRFSASYFEADFASFLAWRDWGFPDTDVFNGLFAVAIATSPVAITELLIGLRAAPKSIAVTNPAPKGFEVVATSRATGPPIASAYHLRRAGRRRDR